MIAPTPTPAETPVRLFHKLWQTHAPLTLSALLTALATLFFIVGLFADPRTIAGAPAWLKPVNFGVSITLYSLTLTWMLSFLRARLVALLGWVVVVAFGLEWVAILTQVVRGTTSHFNVATPIDSALWSLMSAAIVVLWGANFIIAGLLVWQALRTQPLLAPDALTLGSVRGTGHRRRRRRQPDMPVLAPAGVTRRICLRARGVRGRFWLTLWFTRVGFIMLRSSPGTATYHSKERPSAWKQL